MSSKRLLHITAAGTIAWAVILILGKVLMTTQIYSEQELVEEPPEVGVAEIDPPHSEPTPTPSVLQLVGEASYYSEEGCLGCSPNLTMANGERLDDSRLTVALDPQLVRKHKLLNSMVKITNNKNGQDVWAQVTDTGGFGKYNRVADLSLATKEAIKCSSLCQVTVEYENPN